MKEYIVTEKYLLKRMHKFDHKYIKSEDEIKEPFNEETLDVDNTAKPGINRPE